MLVIADTKIDCIYRRGPCRLIHRVQWHHIRFKDTITKVPHSVGLGVSPQLTPCMGRTGYAYTCVQCETAARDAQRHDGVLWQPAAAHQH